MRNRKRLGVVLALVGTASLVVASIAFAHNNIQTLNVKTTKANGDPLTLTSSNAKIKVTVTTEPVGDPGGVPHATNNAKIAFDKALKIDSSATPKCDEGDIAGTDTATAKANCPDSVIGKGSANARFPGPVNVPVVVTAFNGTSSGSDCPSANAVVLLHSDPAAGSTLIIRGPLCDTTLGGTRQDRMFNADVPALPGGGALTEFITTVKKGSFVKAKCGGGSQLKHKSLFTFDGDAAPESPSKTENC